MISAIVGAGCAWGSRIGFIAKSTFDLEENDMWLFIVLPLPRERVAISGASTSFALVGDEGSRAHFHFCPTCGATVYDETEGAADASAIPVGAFADPGLPAPTVSVYEERMHAWVAPPPDAHRSP